MSQKSRVERLERQRKLPKPNFIVVVDGDEIRLVSGAPDYRKFFQEPNGEDVIELTPERLAELEEQFGESLLIIRFVDEPEVLP